MEQILKEILAELKSINSKLSLKTSETLPDALSVDEIREYLNVGICRAYEIINNGQFTIVSNGRKKVIPKEEFLQWYEREWMQKKDRSQIKNLFNV